MTALEAMALKAGDLVETRIGGALVEAVVVWTYRASPTRPGVVLHVARVGQWGNGISPSFRRYPLLVRTPDQLYRHGARLDPLPANVYADFLEERGELRAATILRAEFSLDDGRAGR